MAIIPRQMLAGSDRYSIKCPYTMTAEAICVHNTANNASAENEISYMIRNNNYCSFHFAVDDKEVVQGIPLDRNAFHAGDGATGYGNRKTIAIEICYSKLDADIEKFKTAEKLAAKFIAQLLTERGWSIDRVHKHQDYSGKYCGHRTLDLGWQRFLDMVQGYMTPGKIVYDWRDVKETTVTLNGAPLVNLQTGEELKRLSGSLTYVQMTADGKYVRTAYSRDNSLDNAVAVSDFVVPVAEQQPAEPEVTKVKWVDIEPIETIVQGSVDLVNVASGEVISRVSGDITVVQVTSDEQYARTAYSRDHDLDNGVLLSRLTPKATEPVNNQPADTDEAPTDNTQQDEPAELDTGTTPPATDGPESIDGVGESVTIEIKKEHINWLVQLIKAIIALFKKG